MSVDVFFNPKSIALIGASNKPGKVGYTLARRLLQYKGKVFLVNQHAQPMFGKQSVASVTDIPGSIELAIIAVPALAVKSVMMECAAKRVKGVIIISAGFAEVRQRKLQTEVLEIARAANMRVVGPNTFGVVNAKRDLDVTFANASPVAGSVSCVSQSGALWSYIAEYSHEFQLGFAKFLSLGDMADVSFADALAYLDKDRDTKVILVYMENVVDGHAFLNVLKQMRKPVVIVKAGKTRNGKRAALSHTGSLAGDYAVYRAALQQGGAYVMESMRDALVLAKMLAWQPRPEGKRVVVVTNAGGPGILCADALQEKGLDIVALPKEFTVKLPSAWSHGNPIDVLGDAEADRYREVLQKLARKHAFYDSVVVLLTPQEMSDPKGVAKEVVWFAKETKKPVVCCFMGFTSVRSAKELLEKNHILCVHEVQDVASVLEKITRQR